MKRSAKVCWVGFVFSTLVIAAVTALTVYFTLFRKPNQPQSPPPDSPIPPDLGGKPKAGEKSGLFDHRSHAVPGGDYRVVDYEGVGKVQVELDGSRSHTHYFDEGPPVVIGNITEMYWFDQKTKKILGTGVRPKVTFTRGTHVVGLTVSDNTRDTHTDYARVFVQSPLFDGVYCYFYSDVDNVDKDIKAGPRPSYAKTASKLSFTSASDFPESFRDDSFAMRCTFVVPLKPNTKFNVKHAGGDVRLLVNDVRLALSPGTAGGSSGVYSGEGGDEIHGQLIFLCEGSASSCSVTLTAEGVTDIKHDVSKVVPIIYKVEPATSTKDGGGKVKIHGIGLAYHVKVKFGDKLLSPKEVDENGNSMDVVVPAVTSERRVDITARNRNGDSGSLNFQYSKDGKLPIKFKETKIAVDGVNLISGIKYGPDHRFYATALNGFVYSFALNSALKVQGKVCRSPSIGLNRVALGLAFNYASPKVRLYVSTSILEWKIQSRLHGPYAWANGEITVLEPNTNGHCLDKVGKPIITGLPVSNHDHGVNGLVFDDNGRLHIQVGGFTNAGHNVEDSRLGGIDENPLSGASLVADVNKPNFDGKVTYSSDDPGSARQKGGKDVKVFSSGWRNSFGINIHTNGFLYATDNGASKGFGEMSISCTEHRPLPGNQNLRDKLSKVIKGKYCGHPNRNRGRDDTKQCKFIGSSDRTGVPGYQPPVATFESSTNGVVEYTASTFAGQLKGNLMLSKFATDQSPGKIFRVQLNSAGDLAEPPDALWEASGVSIEMTPWGDLLSPRVYRKEIVVIRPDSIQTGSQTFISVMPNRGSTRGGNLVRVTGYNIGASPVALFAGKPCTEVTEATSRQFFCKTPPGAAGNGVKVIISSSSGKTVPVGDGIDFKYMYV